MFVMDKVVKFFQDTKWFVWAGGVVWAILVYINTMNGLPARVARLEEQIVLLAQEHQKIYDRLAEDEKRFEVTTAEINTKLNQMIMDLTFIRTELFK